jgi:Glycosyl transferase family 2
VSPELSYTVVTPARNEANNLPRLAESLRAQHMRPGEWLIVDNGSTDSTPEVVDGLCAQESWIRLVRSEAPTELVRGGTVTRAFHAGLSEVDQRHDIIVKVDADTSFPPDYFERLLDVFAREPDLGIASGVCFERSQGRAWEQRFSTGQSAWGAARAYRRECLEQVLPLEDRMGWDGIDSLKAAAHGWRTGTIAELAFRHHRREGERDGSRRCAWTAQGRAAHYMGYRWWYLVVRALFHASRDPAAVAMIAGFTGAAVRREVRCDDSGVRSQLRRQQSLRLLPARFREARGELRLR